MNESPKQTTQLNFTSVEGNILIAYGEYTRFFITNIQRIAANQFGDLVIYFEDGGAEVLQNLDEIQKHNFSYYFDNFYNDISKRLVNRWRKAEGDLLKLRESIEEEKENEHS